MLRDHNMTVAQVSENFDMTRAAVKKHLTVLPDGGLITTTKRGQTRARTHERPNSQGLAPVLDWLGFFDAFWDDRLTALKSGAIKVMQ
jgi:DNA-binding transcriptional ArsR family regulator|tara:strand:+ start:206 stop:469 length:264 start_codon:yes stop_codon:yes gene_type:complete